ncbi:mechanosensitive ion channel domain-containing protein [Salinisphaera sp. T31B1]|uniref:mechanosensitive ion channel family protein n=1 Tax=Salinisphaera sp. T31B1 TaxID=727963 RepID=UPI00333F3396
MGRYTFITIILVAVTLAAGGMAVFDWLRPGEIVDLPIRPIAGTLGAVLAAWLASRGIDRLVDGLHEGRHAWQRRLRRLLHVEAEERFREADLFAALVHLLIWLSLPMLLLHIWGLSKASIELLNHFAWTGFKIGQLQVIPAQVLVGAMLLVVAAGVIRWVTARMETQWLARTPLESHTREAIATLTSYVLFVIATLAVLSYAGLDLSKLALIAGALSVGIGFGLQNIVNNFVSGLILLFEQPIRRGNFISVGDTEGFVRRVRIRGTELETLDRMTVIVPNSELITNHLKNWNLRDRFGRIICTVGVAYGSDVRRVQTLLLEVAHAHHEVLSDGAGGVPKPLALFRNFGDSTLDFELRCFVRDITRRFIVISDLNFAIDAAFRDNDITIAFPQLDVWHRSAPPQPQTAPDERLPEPASSSANDDD